MVKVDVLIPVYNEVLYIKELFKQLSNQTININSYYDVNYVFIDGGSLDGTLGEIQMITQKDDKFHLLINPKKYVSFGLNEAIKKSDAKIIVRLDAHTEFAENYIETVVAYILNNKKCVNVGTPIKTITPDNSYTSFLISKFMSHPFGVGASFRSSSITSPIVVDTVPFGCWRREDLIKTGFFNVKMKRNQDDELNWRISKYGDVVLLPGPINKYYSRSSVKNHLKMLYQYGLFKPLTLKESGKLVSTRFIAPFIQFIINVIILLLSCYNPTYLYLYLIEAFLYFLVSYRVSFKHPLFLVLLVASHFVYGAGFFKGIISTTFNLNFKAGSSR